MIPYADLLGQPYTAWRCGQVAVELHRRAGHAVPDGALERPEDFESWVRVAASLRYADGDVILARDPRGHLFAGALVCRRQGLVVTSSHREGVVAMRLADLDVVGVYRWGA